MRYGYQWFWDAVSHMPCQTPPWGNLYAINVNNGQIVWKSVLGVTDGLADPKTGRPNVGGPIVTGGGVVFFGSPHAKRPRAFFTQKGRGTWSFQVSPPPDRPPVAL